MPDSEKVIKGLEELEGFLFKEYTNIKVEESKIYYDRFKSLSDAIDMLKEQKGLMLALEQSNAVNEYLNAEVERLTGLLKEQETVEHALEVLRKAGWTETQDVPFPAELLKEQDAVEP